MRLSWQFYSLLHFREYDRNYVVMHFVSIQALRSFWQKHPDAERPLRAWYALAEKSRWHSPTDIKAVLGNASFVGNNRVIFNIIRETGQ